MTTNPQRVDVERFKAEVEPETEWSRAYVDMEPCKDGEWVRYSDYAALLQQLADHERGETITMMGREIADLKMQVLAAERAREGAEQDRWRTDWPEMTPVSNAHPSIWQSERVIVSLVGGRVTHDVAESFDGKRPLWFIHRDKVRAWQPFPAAFLAANGETK